MQIDNEKSAFSVITDEVNKWDPYGLLRGGAPDDEFSIEVAKILKELPTIESREGLGEKIHEVFSKSFNTRFSLNDCMKIACQIWSRLSV